MQRAVTLVCGILLFTSSAFAAAQEAKAIAKKTDAPKPGWVLVREDVWVRFTDEPSHHIQQARENFLKKDLKAAADDLWLVGGYLHATAGNASAEIKKKLRVSAEEIDRLAKDVLAGKVNSAKSMEHAFARAEHSLAEYYHSKAKAAVANKQHSSAGHYLRSAVNHVENGARWAGSELEAGADATANGVRTVAGKLVKGSGFVTDEVGKGVTWVGREVEKLGKKIKPR